LVEVYKLPFTQRISAIALGVVKRYGPPGIKKLLWDSEFSSDKWDFIDDTTDDCIYPYLERYAKNGSILDLGCGPGNTANELAATAYQTYVGADIKVSQTRRSSS
jgi:SAM-dependent methyltransferase